MRLPFLDRENESARLREALPRSGTLLLVLYGRRRCGKSRLIEQVLDPGRDVYYLADERDAAVQRHALSVEIGRRIRGFDAARYPDWAALLEAWRDRCGDQAVLALDEFPYLARVSPELPSVLQKLLDGTGAGPVRLLLCGSSQRMMQGLVLDRTAPLYGRASEILKLEPLPARCIREALGLEGAAAVEAYAVWGGLPRNWELAADHADGPTAVKRLVLDRNGVLHREPPRLLLDDLRSAVQASSILSLVAGGCHRLSEIAGRLGRPAADLGRPLARLIELGYLERQTPFGESVRTTRRSAYRLTDPFLLYWYRFVQPNESLLELDQVDPVYARIQEGSASHVGEVWEALARRSVPTLQAGGVAWGAAARWWGKDSEGRPLELDVVAESLDRTQLLVGEAEWAEKSDCGRLERELRGKAERLPFVGGRPVRCALWVRRPVGEVSPGLSVFGPEDLLR